MVSGLVIVGASDQALVLIDVLDRRNELGRVVAILDASEEGNYVGRLVGGIEVAGTLLDLGKDRLKGCKVVPAIGSSDHRREIVSRARAESLTLAAIIDPTAVISSRATVADGVFVGPGVIVGPASAIGVATIVNTGAIVEHHVGVGAFCHVGPGVRIAGNCHIEDGVTIGIGASIRDEVRIGAGATVGAGAAVVTDVQACSVVAGVPARPLGG